MSGLIITAGIVVITLLAIALACIDRENDRLRAENYVMKGTIDELRFLLRHVMENKKK